MNKFFALMILSLFVVGSFGGIVSADKGVVRGDSNYIGNSEREDIVEHGLEEKPEDPNTLSNEKPLPLPETKQETVWSKLRKGWRYFTGKFTGAAVTGNAVISQKEYFEQMGEEEKLQLRKKYEESKERIQAYKQQYNGCLSNDEADCPLNAGEADVVVEELTPTSVGRPIDITTDDVKDHVLSHISLVIDNLYRTLERLEQTPANDRAIENIKLHIEKLETFAVMVKEATTEEELKRVVSEYQNWIKERKQNLVEYQKELRTDRYSNHIENARIIQEKTLKVINNLNSMPVVGVTDELFDLHNKFSELIDKAEESYAADNIDEVREYLRQSKEVLRNLLTELNERGISVGEIKNA